MQGQTLNLNTTPWSRLSRDVTSEPSEKYREAQELIRGVIKAIRSYRAHAIDNPALAKFVEQLHHKLAFYLKKHGSFRFRIDEYKFMIDGEIIHQNENMDESLPFLLYRHGFRELSFDVGLSYKELEDFLGTFRSYEILKDSHEDLVTLLWDKEFSHIHFWASDDFLWGPVEIPEKMKNIIEKTQLPVGKQENAEIEMEGPFCLLPPGELDEIKAKIPQEMQQVEHLNVLMILLEVVGNFDKDSKTFERAAEFFERVLEGLLHLRSLKSLTKILCLTKTLLRDPRLNPKELEFVRRITHYFGDPSNIERLMRSLVRSNSFAYEEIQRYLFLLPKNAIAPLCDTWHKTESGLLKMAISNALMELGKGDVQALGSLLRDARWQIVQIVVNVLGKIGKDQCIYYIAEVRGHRNATVRNEALHALTGFTHQDAKALLTRFLDDPEMQIRMNAAEILAKKRGVEALPYLEPLILSDDFDKRELVERKAFLQALGRIQASDSVRILEKVLHRRVFSKRSQWKELKSCIESVLGSMELPKAKVALSKWKKERKKWFLRP
jgi:hypothetical protein